MRKKWIRNWVISKDLIILILLLLTLLQFSFSWLPRKNEPYINSDNMSIDIEGGLVFVLDNGAATTHVSINEYYNLTNFYLKPVSSINGRRDSFYGINYINNELGNFVSLRKTNNNITYGMHAINNGYIDFSFYLYNQTLTNKRKYVYFTPNTVIADANPSNGTHTYDAIRVAINTDETNEIDKTYLYRASRIYPHYAIFREGSYYENNNPNIRNVSVVTSNANLHFFDNYTINQGFLNGSEDLNTNRAIFYLEPNEKRKITIRIWLEGEDSSNYNHYSIGESVKVLIGFVGYCDE